MKILFGTNVLLDVLLAKEPFADSLVSPTRGASEPPDVRRKGGVQDAMPPNLGEEFATRLSEHLKRVGALGGAYGAFTE